MLLHLSNALASSSPGQAWKADPRPPSPRRQAIPIILNKKGLVRPRQGFGKIIPVREAQAALNAAYSAAFSEPQGRIGFSLGSTALESCRSVVSTHNLKPYSKPSLHRDGPHVASHSASMLIWLGFYTPPARMRWAEWLVSEPRKCLGLTHGTCVG